MPSAPIAFIDPGPNLVQYLVRVGERLAPAYRAVFFSRRAKSRSLLRRLGQDAHPQPLRGQSGDWPAPVQLDREGLIGRLRKTSDRAQVRQSTAAFQRLVLDVDAFLRQQQPAAVFFWNGSGLTAAVAEQLARRRGIPCLFGENGYLPNTLQLDPAGVNAFASIGEDIALEAIRARDYTEAQIREFDALLAAYRAGRTPSRQAPEGGRIRPSPLAYAIQAWHDWRERDPALRANRLIPREVPVLPERFVFFPLQVRSDSQLTIHSPLYGNRLDAAIADLDRALRAIDPSIKLVIKLHPADLRKTDYDPLVRAHPDLVWIGGGDVRGILEQAACVVTVNSTVGIEAMLFAKPLVTLGNNFYVREGLVHPVRERADLASQLQRALNQPPDTALTLQFLRYLYFEAFVRAHWRDYSTASIGNYAARMLELIEGHMGLTGSSP